MAAAKLHLIERRRQFAEVVRDELHAENYVTTNRRGVRSFDDDC